MSVCLSVGHSVVLSAGLILPLSVCLSVCYDYTLVEPCTYIIEHIYIIEAEPILLKLNLILHIHIYYIEHDALNLFILNTEPSCLTRCK